MTMEGALETALQDLAMEEHWSPGLLPQAEGLASTGCLAFFPKSPAAPFHYTLLEDFGVRGSGGVAWNSSS